jgi:hypothetical protein
MYICQFTQRVSGKAGTEPSHPDFFYPSTPSPSSPLPFEMSETSRLEPAGNPHMPGKGESIGLQRGQMDDQLVS